MAKKIKRVEPSVRKLQIDNANRFHSNWETLFKVPTLGEYYQGFQWLNQDADPNQPYVVNQFYSVIKSKLAGYLFAQPKFLLHPRPSFSDWDIEAAMRSAQMKQDLLDHLISHPKSNFASEIRRAFIDSLLGFGLIEVGYSADWVMNPNAGKPLFKSQSEKDFSPDGDEKDPIVRQAREIPEDERIYFKRVNFRRFRCATSEQFYLPNLDWYGYWEMVQRSDLLSIPGLKIPAEDYQSITFTAPEISASTLNSLSSLEQELYHSGRLVKVWRIWDNRVGEKQLILDCSGAVIYSEPFNGQDLFDLRQDENLEGFYPIPPAFQWLSPQNEINETREQLRNHRKRFQRKYQTMKNTLSEEEMTKFELGGDGTIIQTDGPGEIKPIENASLGADVNQSFVASRDDMRIVTGTTADQQGVGDRTTATQASIQANRASSRENYEREFIQTWLCKIAYRTLGVAEAKFSEEVWIQTSADLSEQLGEELQEISTEYQKIVAADLRDGYDFRVVIDVVSLSPLQAEEEKKKFLEFIAVMQNFPALATSPILIREAAYRVGYRNEKVIREMQRAALLSMIGQQQENGGPAVAQRMMAKQIPNDQEKITNQLEGQLMQ
jgi:hypothetical protein